MRIATGASLFSCGKQTSSDSTNLTPGLDYDCIPLSRRHVFSHSISHLEVNSYNKEVRYPSQYFLIIKNQGVLACVPTNLFTCVSFALSG